MIGGDAGNGRGGGGGNGPDLRCLFADGCFCACSPLLLPMLDNSLFLVSWGDFVAAVQVFVVPLRLLDLPEDGDVADCPSTSDSRDSIESMTTGPVFDLTSLCRLLLFEDRDFVGLLGDFAIDCV